MNDKIILLTKKYPHWQKLFLKWANDDRYFVDFNLLELGFSRYIKFKKLLKEINPETFNDQSFINPFYTNISEAFSDSISFFIQDSKTQQFIKSIKTEEYEHLFNDDVEVEIKTILKNKVSIKSLKNFWNKNKENYFDSDDFLCGLIIFKRSMINWTKDSYLEKINSLSLNTNIIESNNNTLLIEVLDYAACNAIGPQSWCIVEDLYSFDSYTKGLQRQFIYYDFRLSIDIPLSIIGITVDHLGEISDSYDKFNSCSLDFAINSFSFYSLSKDDIIEVLKKLTPSELIFECSRIGFFQKDIFQKILIELENIETLHLYEPIIFSSKNSNYELFLFLLNIIETRHKTGLIHDINKELLEILKSLILLDDIEFFNIIIENLTYDLSFSNYSLLLDVVKNPNKQFLDSIQKNYKIESNIFKNIELIHLKPDTKIFKITKSEIDRLIFEGAEISCFSNLLLLNAIYSFNIPLVKHIVFLLKKDTTIDMGTFILQHYREKAFNFTILNIFYKSKLLSKELFFNLLLEYASASDFNQFFSTLRKKERNTFFQKYMNRKKIPIYKLDVLIWGGVDFNLVPSRRLFNGLLKLKNDTYSFNLLLHSIREIDNPSSLALEFSDHFDLEKFKSVINKRSFQKNIDFSVIKENTDHEYHRLTVLAENYHLKREKLKSFFKFRNLLSIIGLYKNE